MKINLSKGVKKISVAILVAVLCISCFAISTPINEVEAGASDLPASFDNPVIRTDADGNTFFSADPSVRVFNGKMYMYCSHDIFPANRCTTMDKYHVFSSIDGQNWEDEGEILSSYDLDWGYKGGLMWAPDCEYINGKYYFFYPHVTTTEASNQWVTAVAVSNTPTGPFTDLGPINGTAGEGLIDPNVLKVSDDEVYIYWGGSQKLYGSKISCNGNNVALEGSTVEITGDLSNFHEGSWCFVKDGTYYMTYARSNGDGTESLGYATGTNPLGPFNYRGIMLSPNLGTNMDTTHGCVTNYDGVWLIFYHNMALSGFECLRSVCVDYLTFNQDGTINTVTPAKNEAPPVNKTAPTNATIYPVNSNWTVGNDGTGDTSATLENGDTNIGNLHMTGAYGQATNIDGGQGGRARLWFRYSALNEYSALIPQINGTKFDAAPASPNGSWNDFTAYTSTIVQLQPGMNTVRILGGHGGVNINAIYVEMLPAEPDPPAGPQEYDLYVSAVTPATSSLSDGDSTKFAITLRNLNNTGDIQNQSVKVDFYCDNRLFESVTKEVSINAGGFTVVSTDSNKDLFFGSHSVRAVVTFADSDEAFDNTTNNNALKARFSVLDS